MTFKWNDDRKALLKRLWLEGKTATEISFRFGGEGVVSRLAVAGAIHRLGLSGAAEREAIRGKGPSFQTGDHGGIWADPEKLETLKRMWAEGKSGGEIAKAVGGAITRCGVISKAHRLGLAKRTGKSGPRPAVPAKPRAPAKPKPFREERAFASPWAPAANPTPPQRPKLVAHASGGPGKALAALNHDECHAPRRDSDPGPGRMDTMLYCAAKVEGDDTYCTGCQKWFHVPQRARSAAQEAADVERRRRALRRFAA